MVSLESRDKGGVALPKNEPSPNGIEEGSKNGARRSGGRPRVAALKGMAR